MIFGLTKAKRVSHCVANPLILMVRLAGIEPTTPWFVANTRHVLKDSGRFIRHDRSYTNQQHSQHLDTPESTKIH
jgi:hypothetical protein